MELNPGGRPGGEVKFLIGAVLTVAGVWLFFDSVRFTSGHMGLISGAISRGRGGGGGGGLMETTSMGIVLVPLFIGVIALFFDVRKMWGWALVGLGLIILGVEVVSRFRPIMAIKGTHLIMLIVLMAGGLGLMFRGYVEDRRLKSSGDQHRSGES
ncbi:hypothetical protein N9406_06110 [Verrucomicrobiales bacterium]|jgi:hypothetical protein|nr:hypothetical protein [Verrucomicrobiales bacterium]MDA9924255.1 hypothetical protein [Verrucomicrobiales bacterium]MDB3940521.1 hypothetical protein [Verrucomicrobiales bacterium]MDC3352723.1 hypothetical protein [Verrucomicrobiales bacterium]